VPFQPPKDIGAAYHDWTWSIAWEWPESATTWRLEDGHGATRFLKVGRADRWPNGVDECVRLRWARPFLAVPEVLDCGTDETVDWLLTVGVHGTDATRHPFGANPERLVPTLAQGLAAFHDAAPVEACPFDFTITTAVAHVHKRAEQGAINPDEHLHPEHQHLSVAAAINRLEQLAPSEEDLVVCHGDYCLPNVLLDAGGSLTGYLDLGELGLADRWWDIAVGSWSVTWNLGPGWEELFMASYGSRPDPDRIAFYRLLYDLAS
jgi:kanamycin kinase